MMATWLLEPGAVTFFTQYCDYLRVHHCGRRDSPTAAHVDHEHRR